MQGIDVSYWQIKINWAPVKEKYDFAYIRAGIGNSGRDIRCDIFTKGAVEAGILTGHYHLFRPEDDGIEQANNAIRSSEGYKLGLIPAIDFELLGDREKTATRLLHMCLRLEEYYCVKPLLYTAKGVWAVNLLATCYDEYFSSLPLWVANYGVKEPNLPRCWNTYALWQYSSDGKVDGVASRRCDLNSTGPEWDRLLRE